ncbi:transmembrane 9 superfamily member 11-like protein [Tanacetum coccineum]|uniref:Transmembrane 9 superfamily member 11-like protein n=1 Tax=Tanacetum coccineum TaxID=301880 RepID=A0ABQ5HVB5_9ASTR
MTPTKKFKDEDIKVEEIDEDKEMSAEVLKEFFGEILMVLFDPDEQDEYWGHSKIGKIISWKLQIPQGTHFNGPLNGVNKSDGSEKGLSGRDYDRYAKLGTPEESFAELPLYCHNLKLKNQGTITHIETDDEDRFEIFFSCRRCCDGAHLKGEFLGTMYLAVAMDGNNQILPLAYGVGKSETFRSWDWFLRKLKECITGKQDNLTIISDGAVSIASAIKNVFPNAFHGRCCRHLLMNLREKCPRFISKEELFWKACKAYRISDFEERFTTLRNWLPSVANKLDMIGLEKWARVHFPGMRYNYMTSNSAESVNALSRHSRKLPICMMIN